MTEAGDVSAAIRSIRVAAALSERFGAISRPATYGRPEDLSAVLGEARQLYPEIWSHLDNAREILARNGTDVAAYDQLRANPVAQAPGVLDVKLNVPVSGGVGKTARLNLEGQALAVEAYYVLRAALPNVDWYALERAEAQEIEAAGSLTAPAWKGWAVFFVIVAIAVGVFLVLR